VKSQRQYPLLLVGLAYLSFVSLGLPHGLSSVSWPSIQAYFRLPVDALGSLLVMFTIGYLVSSFCSGRLLDLISLGSLLALSCLATALSLIGYALAPEWWFMVALGSVAGLGAGAIDAGLNTFAATRFNPGTVSWLHASYGVGAASGSLLLTRMLAGHHPWQRAYMIIGCWQVLLAVCFGATRKLWLRAPPSASKTSSQVVVARASNFSTLKLPVVWWSTAVFFIYTGIESAAGIWAYTLFTESRGVSITTAGTCLSIYWGALTVGRLLSGFVVSLVPMHRLLRACIVCIAAGAILIWVGGTSFLSFAGLGLMGLALAPVFPSMISATPLRLGQEHTANGVGFQIAAAVLGQSLLPAIIGVLAGKLGLEAIGPSLIVEAFLLLVLFEGLTSASPPVQREAIATKPPKH